MGLFFSCFLSLDLSVKESCVNVNGCLLVIEVIVADHLNSQFCITKHSI